MEFLTEHQAECVSGGRRSLTMAAKPMGQPSPFRRLPGLMAGPSPLRCGAGLAGFSSIVTSVNQINLALNIVFNGGSIVNNQLNGLNLSVSA